MDFRKNTVTVIACLAMGVLLVFVISLVYQFSFLFAPLHRDCTDGNLLGLDHGEVMQKMAAYTDEPYVVVEDSSGGVYGTLGRLTYSESTTFAHNFRRYECRALFNGGFVVQTEGSFE